MAYEPTEWKTGDVITAEKMNKLEQGVKQAELSGTATEIAKLTGAEEAAAIAAKVNEIIDLLKTRGICTVSE